MKNEIVTLVTPAGEFVGKYIEETDNGFKIGDPRMIVQGPEGNMGFAKGICMTGTEDPKQAVFAKGGVVFLTETNKQVADGWREATSGIVLA